jgi:hypothetical protein
MNEEIKLQSKNLNKKILKILENYVIDEVWID